MDPRIGPAIEALRMMGRAAKREIRKAEARLAKPDCTQESRDFLEHRIKMKKELRHDIAVKLNAERTL